MLSKKHLDNQGRRRTNRRRAVHLSEFLRGDDQPKVEIPTPQPKSQNTIQSSLGTIPSTNPTSTVSPVVTPNIPEKMPPPSLPTHVNAWQMSKTNCENDSPNGSFMPDPKAFPDLGKQVKKAKTLAVPEANIAARAPDSSKARRVCPVLGNFLPKGEADKHETVANWLSDVHTAFENCEGTKPASESLPGTSQLESPTEQEKLPQNSPENKLQQESPSKQKVSNNSSARETETIVEFPQNVGAASQFSMSDKHQQSLSGNRSFWDESDDSALEEETLLNPIRRSLLNANAEEFHPMEREQAGESTQQLPENRHKRRRRDQRSKRMLKRRQIAYENSLIFESQCLDQSEVDFGQEQSQMASPRCYYSAPAARQGQQQAMTQRYHPQGHQEYPSYPTTPSTSLENNADASQSVFRLASLPSTGVGTTTTTSTTRRTTRRRRRGPSPTHTSFNPLPSSISCASHQIHTLSSSSPMEENYPNCHREQSIISPDLLYNRSLLDMDREETQEDTQDTEEEEQLWGRPLNSNTESQRRSQPIVIDADTDIAPSPRKPIFRSPASYDEDYPKPDLNCVPANIKQLRKTVTQRYSDYAFVYTLCAQLAQDCVPMDCYVYLKMVLLASIVSIEPDELRPPLSLCIISTDSLMAHRLMNCIGQLAPRFLGPHEYGLQPAISVGQLSSSRYSWVVASPLLLAQQGVYYAGDWTRLSKEHGEQIEKCLENGTVPVPQLQREQALEAAVWTHWQPENSSNQTLAFAKLCPIFGLPIYMGNGAGSSSDSLWSFLLRQHSKETESEERQPDGLNIPEEDIRLLVQLLHQRQITFQNSAQYMLQKYYVIARRERPTVFTSKTYIVLKQFAESFAKLALRLEVMESDVCVAIFHCEHFAQQIFGSTTPPPPAVNSFSVISHIDPYMNEFGRWLLEYLDRYEDQELGMHKSKRRRTDSWEFP